MNALRTPAAVLLISLWPAVAGGQWPVTGPIEVQEDRAGYQEAPVLAMDSAGRLVVVFVDLRSGGPFPALSLITARARLYDGAGAPRGPVEVVSSSGVQAEYPIVSLARNGLGGVAWMQQWRGGYYEVRGRSFHSAEARWGPEVSWNESGAWNEALDEVASWPDGTLGFSTEREETFNGVGQLSARRVDAAGHSLTPVIRVGPEGDYQSSAIAALPAGRFAVTWSNSGVDGSGEGVRARVYSAEGEPEGDEIAVNTFTAGVQHFPSVAAGATGIVVVWESLGQAGAGYGVFGQRFDLDAHRIGSEFQISSGATLGHDAKVAMDLTGRFVVTWTSGSEDVWVRAYRADGSPYGPQQLVNTEQTIYPQRVPSVALSDAGLFSVAYQSWRSESLHVQSDDVLAWRLALPCETDATTLCLQGGRFLVRAFSRVGDGDAEAARSFPLTANSGGFWFFAPDNAELLVKVLDGCGVNGSFWVFAAGLTDVEVELVVTDTWTGSVRTFFSPGGSPFQPVQQIGLFPGCGVAPPEGAAQTTAPETQALPATSCAPSPESVCLGGGRFRLHADWLEFTGRSGRAQGWPLGEQSALFWFFDDENVELVVKVLDGCSVNDRTWIYATGLTNVAVDLVVEDLETGAIWRSSNPLGQPFRPIHDTNALASCPAKAAVP